MPNTRRESCHVSPQASAFHDVCACEKNRTSSSLTHNQENKGGKDDGRRWTHLEDLEAALRCSTLCACAMWWITSFGISSRKCTTYGQIIS